MSEPGVGSFAAVALGLALVTRVAALAALEPSPALLAALYCSSRSVMVIGSRSLPYARQDGLVSAFLPGDGSARARSTPALLAAVAGAGAALGLASAVAGRRGAAAVVAVGRRRRWSWKAPAGVWGASPATSSALPALPARRAGLVVAASGDGA